MPRPCYYTRNGLPLYSSFGRRKHFPKFNNRTFEEQLNLIVLGPFGRIDLGSWRTLHLPCALHTGVKVHRTTQVPFLTSSVVVRDRELRRLTVASRRFGTHFQDVKEPVLFSVPERNERCWRNRHHSVKTTSSLLFLSGSCCGGDLSHNILATEAFHSTEYNF
jgi:hypothetical protein